MMSQNLNPFFSLPPPFATRSSVETSSWTEAFDWALGVNLAGEVGEGGSLRGPGWAGLGERLCGSEMDIGGGGGPRGR